LALVVVQRVPAVLGQAPTLTFDRYQHSRRGRSDFGGLCLSLSAAGEGHRDWQERGGVTLFALELADSSSDLVASSNRPAILVTATSRANHLVGLKRRCCSRRTCSEARNRTRRSKNCCGRGRSYVVPLLNPDAAAGYFAKPSGSASQTAPPSTTTDMLVDEDGPDDLNQDGLITLMRVKDPEEKWLPTRKTRGCLRRLTLKRAKRGSTKSTSRVWTMTRRELQRNPPRRSAQSQLPA